MELDGTSSAATSVAFLQQLRAHHPEPLIIIWDSSPAHSGDPLRAYLTTLDLRLRLVRLPAYSPDFNADEAIWAGIQAELTANTCFGTKAKVREKVGEFFCGLVDRADEVQASMSNHPPDQSRRVHLCCARPFFSRRAM